MFDNRQLATLILLAVVALAVAIKAPLRQSAAGVFKSFVHIKVAAPFLLYMVWLVGVHWLVSKTGLWNDKLLGDSIFWVGVTGFALIFRVVIPSKNPNIFKPLILDLLKITAFFVAFLNIKLLGLGGEVALQVVLTILVMLRTVAASKPEFKASLRFYDTFILAITVGMVVYTIVSLSHDWRRVDWWHEGRKFLLPFWLTLGAIPYLYCVGLLSRYESLFTMFKLAGRSNRVTIRAKLGVVLALHGRLNDIHNFRSYTYLVNDARSIHDGMAAVRRYREIEESKIVAAQAKQERLERNAGAVGTDEDGRQLDQREFKETAAALEWLATCQMGWYRRQGGRYRPDLLDKLGDSFERHGLPADHGIVMSVSDDGQSWYAYRKTPIGWVLGIGAQDAPPDQWFYENDTPPRSFPSPGAGWGEAAHAQGVNWRRVHR